MNPVVKKNHNGRYKGVKIVPPDGNMSLEDIQMIMKLKADLPYHSARDQAGLSNWASIPHSVESAPK